MSNSFLLSLLHRRATKETRENIMDPICCLILSFLSDLVQRQTTALICRSTAGYRTMEKARLFSGRTGRKRLIGNTQTKQHAIRLGPSKAQVSSSSSLVCFNVVLLKTSIAMDFSLFPITPVLLERNSVDQSWGFRLQGGTDFRLPLSIKKVCRVMSSSSPVFLSCV